jgi:sigma-B regulation protein RsbU (phosphoserine phosphatase)
VIIPAILLPSVGYGAAACVAIVHSWRESKGEEKQQLKWPAWGILTSVGGNMILGLIVTSVGLWAMFRNPRFFATGVSTPLAAVSAPFGFLFQSVIPLSFVFAILKYKLLGINLVVRKTILYTFLSGALGLGFLLLVGGLGTIVAGVAPLRGTPVTVASTLLLAVSAVPLRNRMQEVVDRRFFRQRRDYPNVLQSLGRELSTARDAQTAFKVALGHVQAALQSRAVVFLGRGSGERAWTPAAKLGPPDKILNSVRLEGHSPWLARLSGIVPAKYLDLSEDESAKIAECGGDLVAPVRFREELMAVLLVGSRMSEDDFSQDDHFFLASVTDHVGTALHRLRMEEQSREYERAREIQEALLPKDIPQRAGYRISGIWQPARSIGGDYYDVIPVGERHLGLVIADVSGKGVTAALLMSNLQAAVKAFIADHAEPADLTGRVNRMICGNIAPAKFITFFYGLLDVESGRLLYTNAGHNPPLLVRQDSSSVALDAGGPVLGVFRSAAFEQGETRLRPGDRLVLYTDGVSEAFDESQEEFGEDRLRSVIADHRGEDARELQMKIMRTVTGFCRGDFHDDATLLVVAVEPSGATGAHA